ncbi:MAG: FAA hydrolase family protein, partial [Lysobacter spongiicola]|nr:FAA hydrolase family protein [Lysobacter spongiicola]
MSDVVQAAPPTRIPVRATDSTTFPVRRVYCVGRNFADHA